MTRGSIALRDELPDAGASLVRLHRRARGEHVLTVAIPSRSGRRTSASRRCSTGSSAASAAIVSDEPGTTRDRHFARADWAGQAFWLVDTGGLVEDSRVPDGRRDPPAGAAGDRRGGPAVVRRRRGVGTAPQRRAHRRRPARLPEAVAARRQQGRRPRVDRTSTSSTSSGRGIRSRCRRSTARTPATCSTRSWPTCPGPPIEDSQALRVAVIGRPNVGKSSFVNRLLGEERLVVSASRGHDARRDRYADDAITAGHSIFVDTAGLRRQSKIDDGIEFYSSLRTRRAIERADICMLVVDATDGSGRAGSQDRGAGVGCGPRADRRRQQVGSQGQGRQDRRAASRRTAREKAPFLAFVPFLFTSALTGQRVTRVLDVLLEVAAERRQAHSDVGQVNATLEELLARRQPPQAAGHEVKLNVRDARSRRLRRRSPCSAITPKLVEEHYVRYLHNGFRAAWGLTGNPLRIVMRRKSGKAA